MITQNIIEEVIILLKKHINPQKIILFGSYAYGNPNEHSDLDLFLIKDINTKDVRKQRLQARKVLEGIQLKYKVGLDILIDSLDRVNERITVFNDHFYEEIMNKGKTLYEK